MSGWCIVYNEGSPGYNFVLANSADPDEMPHYAAFHQGLHCLPKSHLGVSSLPRVNSLM